MRMCSIASGSNGNCIYIGSDDTHLLIDVGISKKRIDEGLSKLGLSGNDLSCILITHEHSDHIQGLGVFSRAYKLPIYATKGTNEGISKYKNLGRFDHDLLNDIASDVPFEIGDLLIQAFEISHDANEPCGYRVENANKSMAVATDLGEYNDYIVESLQGVNAILLESNHDVHMLEIGPYPYHLKQRVLGKKGHLSNELSGRLLCDILHKELQGILLGHISNDNNYEELAYETVKLLVSLSDVPYQGEDIPLMVASRESISSIITI